MKRTLKLTIITALLIPFIWGAAQNQQSRYNHILVDPNLQRVFDRFIDIVDRNDLEVDWSQINGVELAPMLNGVQGFYARHSKAVIINYFFIVPTRATRTEKDDLLLLTLAHEIGHSQGWRHIDPDKIGLMNPNGKYDLYIIRGSIGAEQYIVNTYKYKACNCFKVD